MYCLDERQRIPVNAICSSYNFKIRAIVNGRPYTATYEELWNLPLDGLNTIHLFESVDFALKNDPFMSLSSSLAIFVSEKEDIEGFAELVLGKTFFEIRAIILSENPVAKSEENRVILSSNLFYYEVFYKGNRLSIKAKDREGYYETTIRTNNFVFTDDYKELLRNVERFGNSTRIVI
ncbi:MAG: hypothetical protein QXE39_07290 [Saccharolobus sp.]